jgi:hypothetical protein
LELDKFNSIWKHNAKYKIDIINLGDISLVFKIKKYIYIETPKYLFWKISEKHDKWILRSKGKFGSVLKCLAC